MITEVEFEEGEVIRCLIEAVMTKREEAINWRANRQPTLALRLEVGVRKVIEKPFPLIKKQVRGSRASTYPLFTDVCLQMLVFASTSAPLKRPRRVLLCWCKHFLCRTGEQLPDNGSPPILS